MTKFTDMQQRLFDALSPPDTDVSVQLLFNAVYDEPLCDNRWMQQKLGPMIARINRKLKSGKIVPGELKQTYRYDTTLKD